MVKSLVTGGAGFIGSHVAKHCLAMGQQVVVLDDLSGGYKFQVPPEATFVEGSVTDQTLISQLFAEQAFDYVYHLAAYAAEGLSHFIRRFNYHNNLLGSVHLINESVKHRVRCFVFTSSIAVYGRGTPPMHEDKIPQPEDPYGIAKYAIELDLRAARDMFGLNYVIFRPHNVYGEHQNIGDKYRNVVGIFMHQIMKGEPLTVFGDGSQTRAFSYVDDVAIPISKSVTTQKAYNEVFNIGADQPCTINELTQWVGRSFGVVPEINYLHARHEIDHVYADHQKVRSVFGEAHPVPLSEGIARMSDWAQRIGPRPSHEFGAIEINERLPEGWGSQASEL